MPHYGIPPDVEAALPHFLSAWGIEPIEIEEIEEGSENQNLLVFAPNSRFVIRRYRFRPSEEIPFEIEAILECAHRGFPVARPVPDRGGEYVRILGDLPAAVNLYRGALAGPLLDHTRQEVAAQLAECLAEISRATFRSTARRGPDRPRAKI